MHQSLLPEPARHPQTEAILRVSSPLQGRVPQKGGGRQMVSSRWQLQSSNGPRTQQVAASSPHPIPLPPRGEGTFAAASLRGERQGVPLAQKSSQASSGTCETTATKRASPDLGRHRQTRPNEILQLPFLRSRHFVPLFSALLLLCITAILPATTFAATDGRDLAQRVHDRPAGKDAAAIATMFLSQKGRDARERTLAVLRKDQGSDERWSLIRFYQPADIAGTGLLTKDHPRGDSDQWLYLPALGRVRRISSSHKVGSFVGSDFYYEDLQERAVDLDNHRLLGASSIGRIKVEVLESTPKDRSSSVYSKRIAWIHPASLIPLQVDFYEGGSRPTKRLKVRKIKRIQGIWTVMDSTMNDLKSGHQTRLTVSQVRYNQGLPDSLFTTESLEDTRSEQRYTP